MIRLPLLALGAFASVACAATENPPPPAGTAPVQEQAAPAAPAAPTVPGSRAEMVAQLLAGAQADAEAGNATSLTRRLNRLSALGAHPAEEGGDDPVPAWTEAAQHRSVPFRGRALGPAYRRGTLAADGELELTQTFLSGKKAVIAVSSPGGSAPALRVVSASGKTVCERTAPCRWTPVFTERYAIILQNTSRQARTYYLVVE